MFEFKKDDLKRLVAVIISSTIYSLSMTMFVNAGNLFPAGFVGLAYLIIRVLDQYFSISIPVGVVYWLLNIPTVLLVYKYVGKRFTAFSMIHIVLVSILTSVLPDYEITHDILLIAIFGGILSGFGISVALNSGASSGGTDFLAMYFANKLNRPTWNYSFLFSAGVLLIAGYLYGYNTALYSIIYQFCSTQIVNYRHDRYRLSTLVIITQKPEEVKSTIFATVRHGITVLEGKGGYKNEPQTLLYMTVNDFQVNLLVREIEKTDPKCFINISKTERIVGNYYQLPLD